MPITEGSTEDSFSIAQEFTKLFLQMLMEAKEKTQVSILLHTLMPNHFHLVLQQHKPFAIAAFMQRACFAFSRWSNKRANRSGPLFDGPYGGKPILDAHALLRVSHYIFMNPVQAGLVRSPAPWKYSNCRSCLSNCKHGLDDPSLLLDVAGGVDQYAKFLEHFDGGDPESIGSIPLSGICQDLGGSNGRETQ